MFIHRFPDFAGLATCVLSHFIQFLNDDYFEFFVRQTIDLHSLGSFIGTLLVSFRVVIFAWFFHVALHWCLCIWRSTSLYRLVSAGKHLLSVLCADGITSGISVCLVWSWLQSCFWMCSRACSWWTFYHGLGRAWVLTGPWGDWTASSTFFRRWPQDRGLPQGPQLGP